MIVNINLATRPYHDLRRLLRTWGVLVALFVVASVALIVYTLHSWRKSSDVNSRVANVNRQIRDVDADQARAASMLQAPKNRSTVEQSQFLNNVIARKSFSWTRVFMDLEQMMPTGLRVLSLTPQMNKQGQLELKLKVGGASRDKAIELVRRMEQSPRFNQARLTAEAMQEPGSRSQNQQDPVSFDISAFYIPEHLAGAHEANNSKSGANEGTTLNAPVAQAKGGQSR